jgi:hypothetical protein
MEAWKHGSMEGRCKRTGRGPGEVQMRSGEATDQARLVPNGKFAPLLIVEVDG